MFKKYTSIENTYREEILEKIKDHGFSNKNYIVQEKAHGANLSYWTTDGINFFAAKRSGRIAPDEKFYNYELLLEDVKSKFTIIWNAIKKSNPDLAQMTIFGEVIGGNYPQKMVPRVSRSIKVQKGIYYSPDNHFFAFDIMINTETYLNVNVANQYFEQADLLYAKTLFAGSLTDCLAYPNSFDSTIPKELGLPDLSPNICEGVVIRPIETLHLKNGVRVILKNKNEQWSENKKYHGTITKEEPLSEKVIKLQEVILTYATENRLNNVLSKVGEFDLKDFGKIIGMFNKDVVEDFLKDYGHLTEDLEKKELKAIKKSFGKTTVVMIKKKMGAIKKG